MARLVVAVLVLAASVLPARPLPAELDAQQSRSRLAGSPAPPPAAPAAPAAPTAAAAHAAPGRTRRSAECERLALCKLHARSGTNFFAAFELYFVNKENARLWDHRARSAAACERRYGDCRE